MIDIEFVVTCFSKAPRTLWFFEALEGSRLSRGSLQNDLVRFSNMLAATRVRFTFMLRIADST